MEASEIEKHLDEFERIIGIEEYLLKHPIDVLINFDIHNIKEKLRDNTSQLFEFEKLFLIADSKYIELQNLYQNTICEQYDWYKFEFDRSLSKDEVKEFYIPKDHKVKQIKRLLDKQKIKRDFYRICINSFLRQGRRMHDFIKILEIDK